MDYTVRGILQAGILEWVVFPFSRGSSQPRDRTQVSALQADSLPADPQGKPKNTGVGTLYFLQGIFPTQESNQGLLHCRQTSLVAQTIKHLPIMLETQVQSLGWEDSLEKEMAAHSNILA